MKMLVIMVAITSIFIEQLLRAHIKATARLRNSSGILNISPCHLYATVLYTSKSLKLQYQVTDSTLNYNLKPLKILIKKPF